MTNDAPVRQLHAMHVTVTVHRAKSLLRTSGMCLEVMHEVLVSTTLGTLPCIDDQPTARNSTPAPATGTWTRNSRYHDRPWPALEGIILLLLLRYQCFYLILRSTARSLSGPLSRVPLLTLLLLLYVLLSPIHFLCLPANVFVTLCPLVCASTCPSFPVPFS